MAPRRLRPISHEDRLSVVDHLDELRSRLIVCAAVLTVAFGVCFWQNSLLLKALNKPLKGAVGAHSNHISGLTGDSVKEARDLKGLGGSIQRALAAKPDRLSATEHQELGAAANYAIRASRVLPHSTPGDVPITIGVGEPFTTTLTVCFYFALLLSLPVLLYELFAFIIPALAPQERRVFVPIMLAAPVLFFAGVVFTYVVVLPAAIDFLQGYNANQFNSLVQAKPLYSFEVLTMGAIGLAFEMPLALMGLRQVGIINGRTLTKHWRYATVIIAVMAAAMPGADPVTTGLETAPLVILFLASIVLLRFADRRDAKLAAAELNASHQAGGQDPDNE